MLVYKPVFFFKSTSRIFFKTIKLGTCGEHFEFQWECQRFFQTVFHMLFFSTKKSWFFLKGPLSIIFHDDIIHSYLDWATWWEFLRYIFPSSDFVQRKASQWELSWKFYYFFDFSFKVCLARIFIKIYKVLH